MKELWKNHKKAILISGGLLLVLYLFYKYEQSQSAASTAPSADDLASQLAGQAMTQTPLIAGGGTTTIPSTYTPQTPLGNFTNPPSTPGSGGKNNGNGAGGTASNPGGSTTPPSNIPAPTLGMPANPFDTNPQAQNGVVTDYGNYFNASQISNLTQSGATAASISQETAAHCQYQLPGVTPIPGLALCSSIPGGGTINDPRVEGLLPGQTGYQQAVESQLSVAELNQKLHPETDYGVAGLEALLSAAPTSEGGVTPASSNTSTVPGQTSTATWNSPTPGTPVTSQSTSRPSTVVGNNNVRPVVNNPIGNLSGAQRITSIVRSNPAPTGVTPQPVRTPVTTLRNLKPIGPAKKAS